MNELTVFTARQAWNVLRGLTCIYKPPDYPMNRLTSEIKNKLTEELNQFERAHQTERKVLSEEEQLTVTDYSTHPLVLGPGFEAEDISVVPVNVLTKRVSGLVVFAINSDHMFLRRKKYPSTFQVSMVLGQATDDSFINGKIRERSTWDHLVGRPQILDRALSSICASHHRAAFNHANVQLQTQEAYELAAQGPIRPQIPGLALIYGLKCIAYKPPNVTLEVTCINANDTFLAELVAELGLKLRTNAACSQIRCLRYGMFNLDHSLVVKHINLSNILSNMNQISRVMRDNAKQRLLLQKQTLHFAQPVSQD